MRLLYEDGDLLVAVKPPGMASQPDKTGDEDLLTRLEADTKGKVYPVHRLDRPVGGVMVYGKSKAGAALTGLEKTYLAVVCGTLPKEGTLVHFLKKRERDNTAQVVQKGVKGAKEARLSYRVLAEREGLSLVEIALETGRHHQIRVQFAAAGAPLWGDRKYNPAFQRYRGKEPIALWAAGLAFRHPQTGEFLRFWLKPDAHPFSLFDEALQNGKEQAL